MEVTITALGPDHSGLADPIIHHLTARGARIAEIQMYDHDEEELFAMLCRVSMPCSQPNALDSRGGAGSTGTGPTVEESMSRMQNEMRQIASKTGLSIRVWSPALRASKPRLAVACTFVEHTPRAVLEAVDSGSLQAEVPVVISNRKKLSTLADEFGADFKMIGSESGAADDGQLMRILDEYEIDYLILARYMRILPAETCWQFAGGRILNLHHGLLPGFPGFRPYHDAHTARMLTFGATCHFIIPELDAGNQTVNQRTFSVQPGTPLEDIIQQGETENEPACLVEGVRRVVNQEVQLHFHRVIPNPAGGVG